MSGCDKQLIFKDSNPNSRTFQGLEFSFFANSRTFQDFQVFERNIPEGWISFPPNFIPIPLRDYVIHSRIRPASQSLYKVDILLWNPNLTTVCASAM